MIWWCRSDPINFSMLYSQIADLTLTLCIAKSSKFNIPISCPTGVENGFPSKSEKKFVTLVKSIIARWRKTENNKNQEYLHKRFMTYAMSHSRSHSPTPKTPKTHTFQINQSKKQLILIIFGTYKHLVYAPLYLGYHKNLIKQVLR